MSKKTTEEIRQKLHQKFPYIIMMGEYTGANDKMLFKCSKCGYEWSTTVRSVISSKGGCPKCGVARLKNELAKKNFLSRYDSSKYELVEFKSWKEVTVKCKVCGTLRTTTADNIYRYGCPKCGQVRTHELLKLTLEEFIEKAKKVHGNKYDYSKVDYVNTHTPVIIICPKHGEFALMPMKHLSGHGCPKCSRTFTSTEDFVNKAKLIHGNKYDYSKTLFTNANTPVTIICPEHGEFKQLPYVHAIMGSGCQKCSQSHGERVISLFLDKLNIPYTELYHVKNPYHSHNFVIDFFVNNCFIEFNGELHYIPKEFFGGELRFKQLVLRDLDLRQYCLEQKIPLLEIKYNCKNIEKEIINFLKLPCK